MDAPILRLLIQEKLVTGHLPHDRIPRMWGGPGSGETCDACGESVTKDQMVMENLDAVGCGFQFHVACFYVWEVERQVHKHAPPLVLDGRGGRQMVTPMSLPAAQMKQGFFPASG
jgi:hypothetical protein